MVVAVEEDGGEDVDSCGCGLEVVIVVILSLMVKAIVAIIPRGVLCDTFAVLLCSAIGGQTAIKTHCYEGGIRSGHGKRGQQGSS